VVALSVPPESVEAFERIARDEGRNKSELFREMLRVYRAYRETGVFETLQQYGGGRAKAVGVHDEVDVERLIQEVRGV
jgi:metal-responsive CopG/Arc/MetJ family transcriptional regulator